MKHTFHLGHVLISLILAGVAAVPQQSGAMTPGEPVAGRAIPSGPVFVKALTGQRAVIADASGQRLGIVRDHVIDRVSGRLLFVAVTVDQEANSGRSRKVPFERFSWDPEQRRMTLPMTPDDLLRMPVYDEERVPPKDTAAGDEIDGRHDLARRDTPSPELASADIRDCDVVLGKDLFASVDELVLEPKRGVVAFVLATGKQTRGDPLVLPWKAMSWKITDGGDGCFDLDLPMDRAGEAPTLAGGDTRSLEDPDTLRAIQEFYGLPPTLVARREGTHG